MPSHLPPLFLSSLLLFIYPFLTAQPRVILLFSLRVVIVVIRRERASPFFHGKYRLGHKNWRQNVWCWHMKILAFALSQGIKKGSLRWMDGSTLFQDWMQCFFYQPRYWRPYFPHQHFLLFSFFPFWRDARLDNLSKAPWIFAYVILRMFLLAETVGSTPTQILGYQQQNYSFEI